MSGRLSVTASLALLFAALAIATGVRAQEINTRTWMSRDDIVAAFVDRRLSGIYPNGVQWEEHIRSDGTSDYREGNARREGSWWMRGDQFCFRYAASQTGGCFHVSKVGQNCYELYAIEPASRIRPPQQPGHWNGRMWREDSAATCDEKPVV